MSNGLDPDLDRHFVGPDLGPNCLQTTKFAASKVGVHFKYFCIMLMVKAWISLHRHAVPPH